MSSSRNSHLFSDYEKPSSISKFLLLLTRNARSSSRQFCCHCFPLIVVQLLIPLICIFLIIFMSNYVLNNKKGDLFEKNSNEKCSLANPIVEIDLENDCFQMSLSSIYEKQFEKINLIVRVRSQDETNEFYRDFRNEIANNAILNDCIRSNRLKVIFWETLSLKDDSIVLNEESKDVNVIFDLKELDSNRIEYDFVVPMSNSDIFNRKLLDHIDLAFFQNYQHPSEQIDLFRNSLPPFANLKIFFDQLLRNVILKDEEKMSINRINWQRISCTKYRSDELIPTRWSFILILYVISLIYLFINLFLNYLIHQENKQKIKDIIQIIDIQPIQYYLSWAFTFFVFLSLISLILILLMKMSFNGWIIYSHISLNILIITFSLLNVQLVSYSIFLNKIFQNYGHLFVLTISLYLLLNLCSYKRDFHLIYLMNPYFSLIYLFKILFFFERSKVSLDIHRHDINFLPRLSTIYLLMILSILVYWILIWYFEKLCPGCESLCLISELIERFANRVGEYGIGLKWNFFVDIEYWKCSTIDKDQSEESLKSISNEENLIVQVENLTKIYPKRNEPVLNEISFNLYENEITTLIGHNGTGKTTLINILSGFIQQTDGHIFVNQLNTIEYYHSLRRLISYCPQHDILFDLLTVKEQIEFYCKAKGYSNNVDEIRLNLLESIDLIDFENVFCQNLSGGMKRRLSLACAFIGNTKLVLLDEPSSGIDPFNRRLLWDWISSMKRDRTILLTTHFLEEADYLSDEVILLNKGRIIAKDKPYRLKQIYGTGYKLILYKNLEKIHLNLFDLIQTNYFPKSQIEIETNNQLIIQTNEKSSKKFYPILNSLEKFKEKHLIEHYSLANTNLEDVFVNLIKNEDEEEEEDLEENCNRIYEDIVVEQGYDYYLSQYEGLFIKSLLIAKNHWIYLFLIVSISFSMFSYLNRSSNSLKELIYSFDRLNQSPIYLVDQQKNLIPNVNLIYLNNLTNLQSLNQFFFKNRENELKNYLKEFIGMLINENGDISLLTSHLIIGYESIELISNLICKSQCSIKTNVKYLSNSKKESKKRNLFSFLKIFSFLSCFYGIYPGELTEIDLFVYELIYIYITILILNERKEFVDLMNIFGLNRIFYYLSNYSFYFLLTSCYSFVLYAFLFLFEKNHSKKVFLIRQKFYLSTYLISFSTLPFIFLLTKLIKNELIGGLIIYLLLMIIEFVDYIRILFVIINENSNRNSQIYWLINLFIPPLNSKRIISIILYKINKDFCQMIVNDKKILEKIHFSNEINENDLMKYLLISLFQFVIYFYLNVCSFRLNKIDHRNANANIDLDDQLICSDLVKRYPRKERNALDHLTFSVARGECFGLLGLNGAGKTTLYRILVGIEQLDEGFVYLNGRLVRHSLIENEKHIGYCPQYDLNETNLVLQDYFYLFLRLKGISHSQLRESVEILTKIFLLNKYLNYHLNELSGGTRRRMHAALASIPNSNLLLLDEPTTGVDPISRKQMRLIFEYLLNRGTTILLTSHSMEECQLLCKRFAILNRGEFLFLNSLDNLFDSFQLNYLIFVQLKMQEKFADLFIDLKHRIDIQLFDRNQNLIILKSNEKSLLKLFQIFEMMKDKYDIETYDIEVTSIEQIFIYLLNYND